VSRQSDWPIPIPVLFPISNFEFRISDFPAADPDAREAPMSSDIDSDKMQRRRQFSAAGAGDSGSVSHQRQ
jgi:hypothetical protein